MTTYIFEDLLDDEEISFDPLVDDLVVQNTGVQAGFLLIDHNQTTAANTRIHMDDGPLEGSIFLLDVQPEELVRANFTFGGGGLVLIGDDSHSTANDNGANSHVGTAAGDFFMGMGGNDTLTGGGGDDIFSFFVNGATSAGIDSIDGGAGFDVLFLGNSEATQGATIDLQNGTLSGYLPGTSATFTAIEGVSATSRDDSIRGSSADNDLDANSGNDTVRAGLGNDTVWGLPGNDLYDGEGGSDTVVYEEANAEVDVNLATGFAQDGFGGNDTLVSIETVIGSEFDDHIAGDDGANFLDGGEGDDDLIGNGGNDTLDGGAGADTMEGGAGNDTYFVDNAFDQVIEAAGEGSDTVITSIVVPRPLNVENIIFTGAGSVTIVGDGQNNVIGGGGGNDTLSGGAGIDTVSYVLATTAVTINLQSNVATGQGTDVLSGFENATGGRAADTLIGNSGNNVLDGNAGADTMRGGFGNDTYIVDRLTDVVQETSNTLSGALLLPGSPGLGAAGADGITDTVVAAVNYTLGTFIENLTLSGNASRGTGNTLGNRLTGNAGNDTLIGADGNDTLNGGAGNDSLNGGAGNDSLVWGGTGDSYEGGSGSADSVRLSGGNLNLTAVNNAKIRNVEQVDLRVSGSNALTVNAQDVLDLSSSSNAVRVLGNAGDVVNAAGFASAGVSGGLNRYTSGSAMLLVETDVTVNI